MNRTNLYTVPLSSLIPSYHLLLHFEGDLSSSHLNKNTFARHGTFSAKAIGDTGYLGAFHERCSEWVGDSEPKIRTTGHDEAYGGSSKQTNSEFISATFYTTTLISIKSFLHGFAYFSFDSLLNERCQTFHREGQCCFWYALSPRNAIRLKWQHLPDIEVCRDTKEWLLQVRWETMSVIHFHPNKDWNRT